MSGADHLHTLPAPRKAGAGTVAIALFVITGSCAGAVLAAGADHWQLGKLLLIVALAVGSDLTAASVESGRIHISGSLLGICLAAVLLGAGPAALVGVTVILAGWLRWRETPLRLLINLATYASFPLLAGLFFRAAVASTGVGSTSVPFYLLVFATFTLAMTLNFLAIAGYTSFTQRTSLLSQARQAFLPILASELFSALLTTATVYIAFRLGTFGFALLGLVLIIFQYLTGELLTSKQRADKLQGIATTDELTGLGNRERFREAMEEQIAAARESNTALHGHADGPRPLQGDQRHPRPSLRGRAAARPGPAAGHGAG